MIKGNIKLTLRNFTRNKTYSLINIVGLSIGIACIIIILSWVQHELSYDGYHRYRDRIYRVQRDPFSTLAPSFTPLLKQDFPEIEEIVRVTEAGEVVLKQGEKSFMEKRLWFAESSFFSILSVDMLAGDVRSALSEPNRIVLSESMARKYFGEADPLGQVIMLSGQVPLQVTGIIRDIPSNSSFHFDFLASYLTLKNLYFDYYYGANNFTDNVCLTYVRLAVGTDPKSLEARFPAFVDKYLDPSRDEDGKNHLASETVTIRLQKVTDIHLYSHTVNEAEPNGDIRYIRIFSLIAVFILLIACINFINLSIAKGLRRMKEVALKKSLGSGQGKIIGELLTDSFLYVLISVFLAVVLYETVMPYLGSFWEGWSDYRFFSEPVSYLYLAGILVFTILAAGLYPAWVVSRFKPVDIFRSHAGQVSQPGTWNSRNILRRSLVVIQFFISIAVIIGIGVINKQIRYLQQTNLGYNRENMLLFSADDVILEKWDGFKQKLLETPGIIKVTASKRAPSGRLLDDPGFEMVVNGTLVRHDFFMPHNRVEHSFFETYGIELVAGRDFDPMVQTDDSMAVILNETAVRKLGFPEVNAVVGKPIRLFGKELTVIGVCRDFHYESLHNEIPAMITYLTRSELNTVSVRIEPGNQREVIGNIGNVWKEYHKDTPFEFSFLDEKIDNLYKNEQRMLLLFNWFGLLAIVIACMGLYGLTAYTTERRTKEIGIRKANGANSGEIVLMLAFDYTRFVILAFILASPVCYFIMHEWLKNFAYRTSIGWLIFAFAGIVAVTVSLITVSWQSYRAANRNPVDALRYE
jgi:putative ABC transport system permease protein